MAEKFGDVVNQLGDVTKKPMKGSAPIALAVQIVDRKGKVKKDKTPEGQAQLKALQNLETSFPKEFKKILTQKGPNGLMAVAESERLKHEGLLDQIRLGIGGITLGAKQSFKDFFINFAGIMPSRAQRKRAAAADLATELMQADIKMIARAIGEGEERAKIEKRERRKRWLIGMESKFARISGLSTFVDALPKSTIGKKTGLAGEGGAAGREQTREKLQREKRIITLLEEIRDALGRGPGTGKDVDTGKGKKGFNWKKLLFGLGGRAFALWAVLKTMASFALKGIKTAISKSLGLIVKGTGFVLKKAFDLAKGVLGPIAKSASGFIKSALTSVWSMAGNAAANAKTWLLKGVSQLGSIARTAGTFVSEALTSVWSMASNAAANAKTWLLKGASQLGSIARTAGTFVSEGLTSAWSMAGNAAANAKTWGLKTLVNLKDIASSGARTVAGAIKGAIPGMTGAVGTAGKFGVSGAAKLGKLMLRGAKFIPGVGLAITGALALFDGLSAGMEEFKKSGDLGKAVKEGAAGALSGITFGLVSQETISGAFDAIGDKFDNLTTGVSTAATAAWGTVKDLIPTEESLKVSFTKLKDNLAPLSEIKLPTEFSFSAISTSVTSMAKGLNDSFANITGIDVSATLTSIKDGVVAKAGALLDSFENITGIDVSDTLTKIGTGVTAAATHLVSSFENITGVTVPTFSELGTSITNIGTSLKDSFSGIIDKATGFFSDTASWFGDLFSTAPAPIERIGLTDEELAKYNEILNRERAMAGKGPSAQALADQYIERLILSDPERELSPMARGGPVRKGRLYIVGEGQMGGELFIPDRNGQIFNAQRTQQMLQAGLQRTIIATGGPGGSGTTTSIAANNNSNNSRITNYVNPNVAARRPILLAQ